MQTRLISLSLLLLCVACTGCSTSALARKSADDRFKFISENQSKLVTGGRVSQVNWADDGASFAFTTAGERFRYDFATGEITSIEAASQASAAPPRGRRTNQPARGRQRDRAASPDGKWVAISKDWNVIIEQVASKDEQESESTETEEIQVTTDGTRKFRYGTASWVYGEELDQRDAMWWSPDSTKLVFYEFDERNVPDHYITADLTKIHSSLLTEGYPKPGEPNPIANLLIYDLETRSTTRIEAAESEDWYTYDVKFAPTSAEGASATLLFNRTNRRQNVLHLVAADLQTGSTRIVLTETQETWQDNSPTIQFLNDGHRFIWLTEKTGYKQFELRDLDGNLIVPLTRGDYPVIAITRIDEDASCLYYTAFSDETNPLNAHFHHVNLDGTHQQRLTHLPLNHTITLSPDAKWFIAEYEAVGVPPTASLYDIGGNHLATLAHSDASEFHKHRLHMPELFTFKADDGVTDLYGVLYKPSNFKKNKKYPLIIDVYGGPLSQAIRSRFSPARADCERGFLIAQIDNRGTINRGKAFEAATYLRLGDVDLKDQADGVRHLAQRKYIDANRVGIMGHSYGGYMSALALLKFPDVFHVAAAGGTVVDWRQYDTIYTERFMRTPQENPEGYEEGSCLKYVEQLQGRLLLLHGAVDDNVHINNAWQLIDALQKTGKSDRFEMMFYPNAGHSLGGAPNAVRWDFLKRHLLN